MTGDSKKPNLDAEDRELWRQVTRSLNPLPKKVRARNKAEPPATGPAAPAENPPASGRPAPPVSRPVAAKTPAAPPGPGKMETRRVRRLARGNTAFDASIDLHGMTQREAHARLLMFLREAVRRGNRNVLVITGKGRAGDQNPEPGRNPPGVIRRNIRHWLNEPEFSELVAAYSTARQHHGGDGALYLQIRRKRE